MNPSKTYEQIQRSDLEGRELEASVLSRAARKLNRCAQAWDQKGTREFSEQLQEALTFTQRLWTFLQVEIANQEHPMPQSLRQSIFQLSDYVDRTVMKLHSGGSLRDLKSLVDLNNEIAAGLLASRRSEAGASQVEPPSRESAPIGVLG